MQKSIGTAKAIAYIECYNGKRLSNSYFISHYVEHDFTIREVLKNQMDNKAVIFKGFVEFTFNLHNNDVLHLDHSPGNTLIKQTSNGYSYAIIDINRMHFKKLSVHERLKNFVRLTTDTSELSELISLYTDLTGENKHQCITYVKQLAKKRFRAVQRKKRLKKLLKEPLINTK